MTLAGRSARFDTQAPTLGAFLRPNTDKLTLVNRNVRVSFGGFRFLLMSCCVT